MVEKPNYKELLAEIRAEFDEERYNSAPNYNHAFVLGDLAQCTAEIQNIDRSEFGSDAIVFGVRNDLGRLRLLMMAHDHGTLVWFPAAGLRVIQALSKRLQTTIHWISVYEQFTWRAYIKFEQGDVTARLLDNEDYWRYNVCCGEDLTGRGKRKFASLVDFLAEIEENYVPQDTQWTYEKLEPHPQAGMTSVEWDCSS